MSTSSRRAGWITKTTIAVILLVVSFIMIFLPWMRISLKVLGQKFTIPKLIDYAAVYNGSSSAQFKTELYNDLTEISEDVASEGINIDPRRAVKMFELISDSGISPVDAIRVSSFLSSLLGEIKDYLSRNSQDLYGEERIIASMIMDAAGKVTFAAVLTSALLIGTVAAFIFSLYNLLREKKYGTLPYLCCSFVMLILFIVLTAKINGVIKQLASSFSYIAELFFDGFGINYTSSMNLSFMHLGAAGVFSFLFALSALIVSLMGGRIMAGVSIPSLTPHKDSGTDRPKSKSRICPSCRMTVPAEYKYCPFCTHSFHNSSRERDTVVYPEKDSSYTDSPKLQGSLIRLRDDRPDSGSREREREAGFNVPGDDDLG